MQKTVTRGFRGKNYKFDVESIPAVGNQAVHVLVHVNQSSLVAFEAVEPEARYLLAEIAEETAREVNRKAHLMFTQQNTGTAYQGQFNFD